MSDAIEDFPDIDALMAARAGERPGFLEDTPADGLVAAVMRLAMEICVVRDRLDVVERIAAEHEPDLPARIDEFAADAELDQTRAQRRQRLLELLIRDLT